RAEPDERLPATDVAAAREPATDGQRLPAAATAFFCSRSRTCCGSPPGWTATPMFCWTSTFTRSHAGSVVGTSFAFGNASRYGLSFAFALICESPDFVTGRKPSAVIQRVMFSG